ncbi:MAG TPA: ABC transporter permease [Chitinophagaceae bacterium]|nr:ABC transporter permease [Chitinophagaceae bacterium]
MFKTYLRIGWRNLVKNKVYTVINVLGLSIGLSCFLLIALYVMNELSYDRVYPHSDRIYRINSDLKFGGADMSMAVTSDMMGQMLKKDYPQVENYTRIYPFGGNKLFKKGSGFIEETKVANVDSSFFDLFQLPTVEGDIQHALTAPNSVVLTESMAKKYFGSSHAVGKIIETRDATHPVYRITAVIKDFPKRSHFNFDFLFPMLDVDYHWGQFTSYNFYTYLRLKEGTGYKAFEKNFDEYINRYVLAEVRQFMNVNSMDELKKRGNRLEYSLMPVTDIHLYSHRSFELTPGGNIQYVYIFSAVALFILLLACINFMNLTTAHSANRAKEVGIRKVLGTERRSLILQFIFESVFLVVLAMLITLGLVKFALPLFNQVADTQIPFTSLFTFRILLVITGLPLIVGMLAGSYPAFFLSAFRPIEVLKGKIKAGTGRGTLRNVLVVFQFATSIILIVATIVVYEQLHYIQTKNLGYNKDQVLIVNGISALNNKSSAFKSEVLQMPGVVSATISAYLPVSSSERNSNSYAKDAVMTTMNSFDMQTWDVDYDYINTLGMKIMKGRNFSPEFSGDSDAIVINETTEKILGYTDPIGKNVYKPIDDKGNTMALTIIGVVKNFNFESLHQQVGPLNFRLGGNAGLGIFKIKATGIQNTIAKIEDKWKSLAAGLPFTYRFLNNSFDEMYHAEDRVGKIAMTFALLAIFIACLGLFGLATFIAEQRTKEIGIRKVLGATVKGIVQMLTKDFVKLIAIAFILATPLAWWAMHSWLQDFAYRISVEWWMFVVTGLAVLVIALMTVSFRAIRAAIANPVKSLRTE